MSDLWKETHATVQAIATVRRGHGFGLPPSINACDGRESPYAQFRSCDAEELMRGQMPVNLPTCEVCLVLLDAAMQREPDPMKGVVR